jgi:hypothetical protein
MGTKRKYHGEHGLFSRLYTIWKAMHLRCRYESHVGYKRYGAVGITICDDWFEYIAFRDWAILNGYNENLTIDRIDNDKGYDPSNCRWITKKEQASNKKNNVLFTIFDETKTQASWIKDDRCVVSQNVFCRRIKKGIDPLAALTTPCKKINYTGKKLLIAFGESKIISEWVKDERCVVNASVLYIRISKDWDHEKAITTPSKILTKPTDEYCTKGHYFDDANTNITKQGHRRCRECDRQKEKRRVRIRRCE